jgi:pheromone shutdown-related protein TraB
MKSYKNLTIIGTSHIAIQSINDVRNTINSKKPDIVAIELDLLRLKSIISKKRGKISIFDIKKIGVKGFLFNLIGAWAEKKLGEIVGTKPGSEMIEAVKTAYKNKSNIALIDQDIKITMKKLSKTITFKEKLRFVYDIIKGIILRKPIVKFDLRKVPEEKIIKKLTQKLKKDYPSFHKILIEERDIFMAKNLYNLMKDYNNIVAVVGAGHENSIIQRIKNFKQTPSKNLVILKPKT